MDHENIKHVVDVASILTAIATMAHWLPEIAALFTVIWTGMRMYDWIADKVKAYRESR